MRSDYRGVPAGKFVHERGILCAELWWGVKFVHERGVLCAEFGQEGKFVHERGILCAELPAGTGPERPRASQTVLDRPGASQAGLERPGAARRCPAETQKRTASAVP